MWYTNVIDSRKTWAKNEVTYLKRTFLLLKVWWGNTVCLLFLKAYLSMFWIPLRFLLLYNIDSIKSIIDVWLLYLISFNKEYNWLNMGNYLNCYFLAYWCFNISFSEYITFYQYLIDVWTINQAFWYIICWQSIEMILC